MDKFLNKLKTTKIIGICGSLLIAIGTFLPIASTSVFDMTQKSSYLELGGDGIVILILSIISLLMIFADKLEKIIPIFSKIKNPKLTLIPTAICAIVFTITALNINSNQTYNILGISVKSNLDFGFWFILLGIVILAIYPILYDDKLASS